MAGTLHDELLAITGIADAEIQGGTDLPGGVKVRLEPDADPDAVGRQVQAVLEYHGLRSRVGGEPTGRSSPPPPPGAPGSVVPLPTTLPFPPPPPVPSPAGKDEDPATPSSDVRTAGEEEAAAPAVPQRTTGGAGTSAPETPEPATGRNLVGVTVEEGSGGTVVSVIAADGSRISRRSRSGAAAVDEAIVAAVGSLDDPEAAQPLIVGVSESTVDDTAVLLVVVEVESGERRAGAAVVEGGRAFALASAVWAALRE